MNVDGDLIKKMQDQGKIIVLKRIGKKNFSPRTQRDHIKMKSRIEKCGMNYNLVVRYLKQVFVNQSNKMLLAHAKELEKHIPVKVDRLAKRNHECLLCWFCENWVLISQVIDTITRVCNKTRYVEDKSKKRQGKNKPKKENKSEAIHLGEIKCNENEFFSFENDNDDTLDEYLSDFLENLSETPDDDNTLYFSTCI